MSMSQGLIDEVLDVLEKRIKESGRTVPVPRLSERALARLAKEEARQVRAYRYHSRCCMSRVYD